MRTISSVALDSMIFIYLFEEDERFSTKVKPLFMAIEKGNLKGVTSIVSPLEVLSAPKLEQEHDRQTAFIRFFQKTPNLTVYPLSWKVMENAAGLRRKNPSLKAPDSIQLATARETNTPIYITNDQKLEKLKIKNLKIVLVNEIKTQKLS